MNRYRMFTLQVPLPTEYHSPKTHINLGPHMTLTSLLQYTFQKDMQPTKGPFSQIPAKSSSVISTMSPFTNYPQKKSTQVQ
jgi:hypothetical protein